jgi:iron complex transport system substrate-binding protein
MKKKTLVLVGIAVCAILLASPALASAGYSKIYGNANEDDTLDMRDVTYLKLVIFGKKPETKLADANNDGKISMLDIGQTKLIILGKEKKLTLVDMADRTVTVNMPVERVVTLIASPTRIIVEIGGMDGITKLVGVDSYMLMEKYSPTRSTVFPILKAYPELKGLPSVGNYMEPNNEQIVLLKPDVVFTYGSSPDMANRIQEQTDIPTVSIVIRFVRYPYGEKAYEPYRLIGKVIGKEEEAEELISYANEKFDEIVEVTSRIDESEKVRVYSVHSNTLVKPLGGGAVVEAGGIDVAEGYGGFGTEVTLEQVIDWNPDIILLGSTSKSHTVTIDDVLSDSRLQTINAVKNRKVYFSRGGAIGSTPATGITKVFFMAKLFYPEKFKDLNVEEECNKVLERFYGVDGLYTWMQDNSDLYKWE